MVFRGLRHNSIEAVRSVHRCGVDAKQGQRVLETEPGLVAKCDTVILTENDSKISVQIPKE